MDASLFDRHVTGQLCWVDGSPTRPSSARQRQCPRCRCKWSYRALAKRWLLAQAFCAGRNRRAAAQAAEVDVHTAGRHYAAFERALTGHLRRNLRQRQGWTLDPVRLSSPMAARRLVSLRQKRRLAAQVCLEGLTFDRRMDLIYDLAFSARVERLVRRKPVRRTRLTSAHSPFRIPPRSPCLRESPPSVFRPITDH